MSTEPVFVLVTANTCRHCVDFKSKHWDEVKQYLVSKNIRFFDYAVPSMGERNALTVHHPTAPYHIRTKVSFYPTLMLVESSSWERASASPNNDLPLLAEVYGAEMSSGGRYIPTGAPQITTDSVKEWIQTCKNKTSFGGAASANTNNSNPTNTNNTNNANNNPARQPLQVQNAGRAALGQQPPANSSNAATTPPTASSSSGPQSTGGQTATNATSNPSTPPMTLRPNSNGQVQLATPSKTTPGTMAKHATFEAPSENVCRYGYFSKRV